ncbi:MAG: hypothetical protein AAB834_03810 [Patescibacteria group bacterium]
MKMHKGAYDPTALQPPGYEKAGEALLVEETAQRIMEDRASIQTEFAKADTQLGEVIQNTDPVTREFRLQTRRRQLRLAVGHAATMQMAIPRMTNYIEAHGSLTVSEERDREALAYFDSPGTDDEQKGPIPPLLLQAMSARYWLVDTARRFLEATKEPSHPFHAYPSQFKDITDQWQAATFAWKESAGKDRLYRPVEASDNYGHHFIHSLVLNVRVSLDEMTALGVREARTSLHWPTVDQLASAAAINFPRLRWIASASRQTSEHKSKEEGLEATGLLAYNAASLLCGQLISANTTTELLEPFEKFWSVRNEANYCPVPSLQDGPWEYAAACAGDIEVLIKDEPTQANIANFLEAAGLPKAWNTRLGSTTVGLAMAKVQAQGLIYPPFANFPATH